MEKEQKIKKPRITPEKARERQEKREAVIAELQRLKRDCNLVANGRMLVAPLLVFAREQGCIVKALALYDLFKGRGLLKRKDLLDLLYAYEKKYFPKN
ncbi:MAG: hypothetical protein ACRCXN_12995 [Bacteroidales bacterium]